MTNEKFEQPQHWYNKIPRPSSGTSREWKQWEKEMKSKYPVRFFLQDTLPDFFSSQVYILRHQYIWPLIHTLHPKYRYHIVNTGLKPGYYDADILILHSVFNILSEFVERNTDGHIDWQSDEQHREIWDELVALDNWWKNIRPHREEGFEKEHKYPDLDDLLDIFEEDRREDPDVIEFNRIAKLHHKAEEEWHNEDEEMLIRVIKVRRMLWD